jgi:hypothetical protein
MSEYTIIPGGFYDLNYRHLERKWYSDILDVPADLINSLGDRVNYRSHKLLKKCDKKGQYYLELEDTIDIKMKTQVRKIEYTAIILVVIMLFNFILIFKDNKI